MVGSLFIRGTALARMQEWYGKTILTEFPDVEGKTVLAAIALPHCF